MEISVNRNRERELYGHKNFILNVHLIQIQRPERIVIFFCRISLISPIPIYKISPQFSALFLCSFRWFRVPFVSPVLFCWLGIQSTKSQPLKWLPGQSWYLWSGLPRTWSPCWHCSYSPPKWILPTFARPSGVYIIYARVDNLPQ